MVAERPGHSAWEWQNEALPPSSVPTWSPPNNCGNPSAGGTLDSVRYFQSPAAGYAER